MLTYDEKYETLPPMMKNTNTYQPIFKGYGWILTDPKEGDISWGDAGSMLLDDQGFGI